MVENFRILAIRRRSGLRRFFSLNVGQWYVDVELDDGRRLTLTVWTGGWPYYAVISTRKKIGELLERERPKKEKKKEEIDLLFQMKQYEGKTFPIQE